MGQMAPREAVSRAKGSHSGSDRPVTAGRMLVRGGQRPARLQGQWPESRLRHPPDGGLRAPACGTGVMRAAAPGRGAASPQPTGRSPPAGLRVRGRRQECSENSYCVLCGHWLCRLTGSSAPSSETPVTLPPGRRLRLGGARDPRPSGSPAGEDTSRADPGTLTPTSGAGSAVKGDTSLRPEGGDRATPEGVAVGYRRCPVPRNPPPSPNTSGPSTPTRLASGPSSLPLSKANVLQNTSHRVTGRWASPLGVPTGPHELQAGNQTPFP